MSTPTTVAKTGYFVHFGSQFQSNVKKSVRFGPQKYKLLFNIRRNYLKSGFEGKLTTYRCQKNVWHCFMRQFSHFQ